MGAWGINNFENDSALDWVLQFELNPNIEFIIETLIDALDLEYIEVDEASSMLAAGEVLAAINGRPSVDFPDRLSELIKDLKLNKEIQELALRSILKIKNRSELQELWEEGGDKKWSKIIDDLIDRINFNQ